MTKKNVITTTPGHNVIKPFAAVIYKCSQLARVSVPRKSFKPGLMFVSKIIAQCYKTFFVCSLRFFVIGWSVCETRFEKLTRDKHSISLQMFIKYGR
jgi:hypothetical protein